MENKEAKIDVSEPDWSIVDNTFTQTQAKNISDSKKKRRTYNSMEMLKQLDCLRMWNKIFLLVCVVAVSLDPLFFYVPMIDQNLKCIKVDKELRTAALLLRSLMDIVYVIDIIYYIVKAYEVLKREHPGWVLWKRGPMVENVLALAGRLSWSVVLVDFLAILPVPQITILVLLPNMSVSGSSAKKWLNAFLLSQYAPRIFRIFLSCRQLKWTQDQLTRVVWVKGGFNFFLYILSSHVFGGFWYFYSFQRETSCWHEACHQNLNECKTKIIYNCYEAEDPSRIKLLNSECPVNSTDGKSFDFGIFKKAIESGMLGSNDFPEKLFNCFWWGLKNLSSYGSNLETSKYIWENCFAIFISIVGLLLFLYLIGNLQTYMQLATTRSEEIGEKMKSKERDIELWIERNGLPKDLKMSIMQRVRNNLEENKDVEIDVQNLLSILPHEDRKSIKRRLCLPIIRKVPVFQNMGPRVLDLICEHLKPVIYTESSYMIREGDPLDRMLFITQGTAWSYKNSTHYNSSNSIDMNNSNGDQISSSTASSMSSIRSSNRSINTRRLKKRDCYGEELVEWSLTHNSISDNFPISTTNVKSHTKVEAFALMANDLLNALRKDWWLFRRNLATPPNSTNCQWEAPAVSAIQSTFRRCRNKKKNPANTTTLPQLAAEGKKYQSSKYQRLQHKYGTK